jgi:hypothetical protein
LHRERRCVSLGPILEQIVDENEIVLLEMLQRDVPRMNDLADGTVAEAKCELVAKSVRLVVDSEDPRNDWHLGSFLPTPET